jgi:ABC-type Fe3+-hydroxamate transport system substrate-binding protein
MKKRSLFYILILTLVAFSACESASDGHNPGSVEDLLLDPDRTVYKVAAAFIPETDLRVFGIRSDGSLILLQIDTYETTVSGSADNIFPDPGIYTITVRYAARESVILTDTYKVIVTTSGEIDPDTDPTTGQGINVGWADDNPDEGDGDGGGVGWTLR